MAGSGILVLSCGAPRMEPVLKGTGSYAVRGGGGEGSRRAGAGRPLLIPEVFPLVLLGWAVTRLLHAQSLPWGRSGTRGGSVSSLTPWRFFPMGKGFL